MDDPTKTRAVILKPDGAAQEPRPGAPVLFLAGSIDEGRAESWQTETEIALCDLDAVIMNPRRDVWNAALRQDMDEPEFSDQVHWELDGIEDADVVLFHFSPAGPAPVTLLELGISLASGKRIVVSCPEGYWRRGNVQITCARAGIAVHGSLTDALDEVRSVMSDLKGNANRIVQVPFDRDEIALLRDILQSISDNGRNRRWSVADLSGMTSKLDTAIDKSAQGDRRRAGRLLPVTEAIDGALRRALIASSTHVADPIMLDDDNNRAEGEVS